MPHHRACDFIIIPSSISLYSLNSQHYVQSYIHEMSAEIAMEGRGQALIVTPASACAGIIIHERFSTSPLQLMTYPLIYFIALFLPNVINS